MTAIERRALYNLLRMNWLNNPQMKVDHWQVDDYRIFSTETLFERLKKLNINLDKSSFIAYADECESPEDLTEQLVGDRELKAQNEDQVYLLIFELWRRLLSEKPSLSIICNELDQLIYQYDQGKVENSTLLQDQLNQFITLLDENADQGIPPQEVFTGVSTYCANDIETFLYDFISERIEEENEAYALDLLDDFSTYLGTNKWFDLLRARLSSLSNRKIATKQLSQLLEDYLDKQDLEFNLELLSFMTEIGDPYTFKEVLQNTLPLLQTEEDFQDFLFICADYCHRLDQENKEKSIHILIHQRSNKELLHPFNSNDPALKILLHIFE
ncbi:MULTISPECIES: hypothetical protein [unclassified Candidatus Protochlamydia]|uniref:hypothetical protein n=1 Tax=unclassified Candidatus Protochlamydia TaxID=2644816 RepID=UPI000A48C30C|nr:MULTISPECIES: hypothetical protein [unclassified Candidatus Protochlamydia]